MAALDDMFRMFLNNQMYSDMVRTYRTQTKGIIMKLVLGKSVLGILLIALTMFGFNLEAMAISAEKGIKAYFPGIKVYVDDYLIAPKDAVGNAIEPFSYNGTTFLPVRAVAGALNMDVSWDGSTKTVILKSKTTQADPAPYAPLSNKEAVTKSITITYDDIKITIDGTPITPKDASGRIVEPFTYDGTTYLPVRAIANALGKAVQWDGGSSSVYVGEHVPAQLSYPGNRSDYRLDLVANGTAVTNRETGATNVVPYGQTLVFNGRPKYSKDTGFIIHHVRTHAESYTGPSRIAGLPVDFLRTGLSLAWEGKAPRECISERFESPFRFPDMPDKVTVAYVNMAEYSHVGNWDPSFDPAWDKNNDAVIDEGAGPLSDYVDTKVFNAPWKNYVAKYWTDSWREQLKQKLDLVAVEHFDGVMFDVMTGYWTWKNAYPLMDVEELRQRMVDLMKWAHDYAKGQYGTAFLITVNLDNLAYQYFPDLGDYVDGGYYQNAFFSWDGSAVVDGAGLSESTEQFSNPSIDFLRDQGLSLLDMDHIGTGPVTPGLDFKDYNDRITEDNLLLLFRWAIDSGSTPFVTPVFMDMPYSRTPRMTRILPDLDPATNTSYDDWVIGSAGADLIYGGAGDDRIDGGAGQDTAYYPGPRADYDVSREGETVIVAAKQSGQGKDVLTSVERLVFFDSTESTP